MEQYKTLADIYDYLVQGIDFEDWIDYVERIIKDQNVQVKTVMDIGCGTGNTTIPYAKRGYENVTGIDISEDMLKKARHKSDNLNLNISFIKQDMRKLNLDYKFDLITCFHDSINYLLSYEDLRKTFQKIQNHLNPGGIFIFDLNTLNWIPDEHNNITYIDEADLTVIWESAYEKYEKLWQINLIGFIKTEHGYYMKFKEKHTESSYTQEEINWLLRQSGLSLLNVFDAFSFAPPRENSIRWFFIAENSF